MMFHFDNLNKLGGKHVFWLRALSPPFNTTRRK
jgi:hypothetical protein